MGNTRVLTTQFSDLVWSNYTICWLGMIWNLARLLTKIIAMWLLSIYTRFTQYNHWAVPLICMAAVIQLRYTPPCTGQNQRDQEKSQLQGTVRQYSGSAQGLELQYSTLDQAKGCLHPPGVNWWQSGNECAEALALQWLWGILSPALARFMTIRYKITKL